LTIIGNETGGRIVIPIVVSAAIPGTAAGTNNTAV
jgi:hypothetical protein